MVTVISTACIRIIGGALVYYDKFDINAADKFGGACVRTENG